MLVITGRNTKLKRAIPTSKITASYVTNPFLEHSLISIEIFAYLLSEKGKHFVWNFSHSVSRQLKIRLLTTKSYHTQSRRISHLIASINMPDSRLDATSPQSTPAKKQLRIVSLILKKDAHICKSQKRYRQEYDRGLRDTLVCMPNEAVMWKQCRSKFTISYILKRRDPSGIV